MSVIPRSTGSPSPQFPPIPPSRSASQVAMHPIPPASSPHSTWTLRLGLTLGLSIDLLALVIALPSQAEAPRWFVPIAGKSGPSIGQSIGQSARPAARPSGTRAAAPPPSNLTKAIQPQGRPNSTPQWIAPIVQTPIPQPAIAQQPGIPQPPIATAILAQPIEILSPTPQARLDLASTTITLRYPIGSPIELKVNGNSVSSSLIGRTETDRAKGQITQTWYGVTLQPGDNQITAEASGLPPAQTRVTVSGAVRQLRLTTAETRIPADGRSTVTVIGQLLDDRNTPSNREALVTLSPSAGEFLGTDADSAQPGYQVQARNGEFQASLRSSTQAQTVRIQAKLAGLDAFTQVQFETSLRPSIATGVLDLRFGKAGLDYRGSFRDFLPQDRQGYELSGRGALFAMGRVGDWLLTGALNSDRPLNQTCDGANALFRSVQFCEQAYPVTGDGSSREVLTPSTDRLYLKLERSSVFGLDYAMWGDYGTAEWATASQQFTAMSRQLHGFKANYNLGNLQLSGLYANNIQGFQRDTIAPDGTSGTYVLSRRLLLSGSETLTLELEELNRPGTVLPRQSLNRGQDYDIDYDRGTITFRQPILRTELDESGQVLVRKIVVTYQYDGSGEQDATLIAARARYHLSKLPGQESWLGGTYLRERQGDHQFDLYGADLLVNLKGGSLIAEYARSRNQSDLMGEVSGNAYRIEAQGNITKATQLRAYYRRTDPGFANNATISFVPGQTRYGATLATALSPSTKLRLHYDHEDNQGVAPRPLEVMEDGTLSQPVSTDGDRLDNTLTTLSAGLQQSIGQAQLSADYIHRDRRDRIGTDSSRSEQLRTSLSLPLTSKLTFTALNETTLSATTDAVYGDRTALALTWAVMPGLNLQAGQQFFGRGANAGQSITNLGLNGEYKLGSDTTLKARYGIVGGQGNQGWTTQGAIGLSQGWTIAPGLRADITYERLFGGFFGQTAAGRRDSQPFTSGQTASTIGFAGGDSYSIGLDYSRPDLQANLRYEHRSASSGSNRVLSAAATGKLSPAITALIRYQQSGTANQRLDALGDSRSLKLGLAYRDPRSDKFNALLRYEYRNSPSIAPDSILFGSGSGSVDHVIAAEAIYAPNPTWEFYGKFALRNSRTVLAEDLVGSSTLSLAQFRATYHLNYSWDLVGEARWIGQPSLGYSETGALVELGYYLTPNLRLAAGYTFGKVSDRDFDGSRSDGGFHVGLTIKLTDLIDGFGGQKPLPKPDPNPATPPSEQPAPVPQS